MTDTTALNADRRGETHQITYADLFQKKGRRTDVFVRFSTVAGGAGSIDTPRDVSGCAVNIYTHQGNWDLGGNNIPVFFIQHAIKFPDLIHAAKMEADRGYPAPSVTLDACMVIPSAYADTKLCEGRARPCRESRTR